MSPVSGETQVGQAPGVRSIEPANPLGGASFLSRTVAGWDTAFWLMLAIATVVMLLAGLTRVELAIALALVALLGVAYAFVGRPAIRSRAPVPRHGYRIVLVVVMAALVYLEPAASFLLFIAFPQVWVLSERIVEGTAYTILIICGLAVAEMFRSGWSGDALLEHLPWWSISLMGSVIFGIWVSKIIDESGRRAELIDRLERTQAELAAANHAAGVVAERERLAVEIHDTLAQGFTGIITLAGAAQSLVARGDLARTVDRLTMIEDIARDNLGEARALVAAFSPLGLNDSTLVEALRRLAARFEAETGVHVTVRTPSGVDHDAVLPAGHQVVLLRIAQEALANVRKHADATTVEIALSTGPDGYVEIEVTDDGSGFDAASLPRSGFGLAGMRGRVEDAGGQMQVDSAPGVGTLIRVLLPPAPGGAAAQVPT